MEALVVSKQTPSNIKKAVHLAAKLKAVLDSETAKKVGERGVEIGEFRGDFVITVGGDGTFLWVAEKTNLPILPLRAEGVGFLCSEDYEAALKEIKRIKAGVMEKQQIPTLKLSKEGKTIGNKAVNEIVVSRPLKSKILRSHITVLGETFYYKGDGFVVSTMQGATAYNLSLGGPVISNDREIVLTPMAPITRLSPVVASPPVEFMVERSNEIAILDGNRTVEIEKDVWYEISFGRKLTILSLKPLNHFKKYIQSLGD